MRQRQRQRSAREQQHKPGAHNCKGNVETERHAFAVRVEVEFDYLLIPQFIPYLTRLVFYCSWRRSPQSRLQLTLELPA